MTDVPIFQRLRELQGFIQESGVGGSQFPLPAPRLLLLPDPSSSEVKEEVLFAQVVTEPEIVGVAKDLFESGFYSQAVDEAFKALDKYIQMKSRKGDSGTKLMNEVFSPSNPVLAWSTRETTSEKDEQKGYHFLYAGAFMGIRNPTAHEIEWFPEHTSALDVILVAQHLLRKAKTSKAVTGA